jgi:hypothetical protein
MMGLIDKAPSFTCTTSRAAEKVAVKQIYKSALRLYRIYFYL